MNSFMAGSNVCCEHNLFVPPLAWFTYLFSYCYVIVQNIYFSLFAMGFVTVYGMFCIQHFLTEQSGNSIQEPTNTKEIGRAHV